MTHNRSYLQLSSSDIATIDVIKDFAIASLTLADIVAVDIVNDITLRGLAATDVCYLRSFKYPKAHWLHLKPPLLYLPRWWGRQ